MAVTRNVYRILATKPEQKRPLGTMQWWAVVKMVMNIYIPGIAKNFFNN
jgi:hypothetical protein